MKVSKRVKDETQEGHLILALKGGRLSISPVADSDEEAAALLRELHRLVQIGDFAEALERSA